MSDPFLEAGRAAVQGGEEQQREADVVNAQAVVQGQPGGLVGRLERVPAPGEQPESWAELTRGLPVLQGQLADPARAARLAPDVKPLGVIERLFGGWRDIAWETKQAWQRGRAQARVSEIGYRQAMGWATPEELAEAQRLEALMPPEAQQGFVTGIPAAVAESAPMMLGTAARSGHQVSVGGAAGLAAGAAAGGVTGPGAVVTGGAGLLTGAGIGLRIGMTAETAKLEKGGAYREYMQIPGVTHEQAAAASTFVGIANGVLEVLPLDVVLRIPGVKNVLAGKGTRDVFKRVLRSQTGRAAVARAAARLAGGMTLEGLTEAAQELSTVLGGQVASGEGIDLGDVDWGRVADAGVKGAQAGVGMGAPGVATEFASERAEAARAKERARFFEALGGAVQSTKALPEDLRAYVQEVQDRAGGPVAEVSAPVEPLMQLFQKNDITLEQISQRMPAVARQIEEATAAGGGEVTIPVADFAATVARLKGYETLVPDLRVGDELTLREAKQVEADAKALAAKEQKREARDQAPTPEQRVVADVAAKLEAAGQDAETARTNAALWGAFSRTLAARAGAPDAFAFYEQLGLTVENRDVAPGAGDLAQTRAQQLSSPEFKAWFAESKTVTKSGRPIIFSHGTAGDHVEFSEGVRRLSGGDDGGFWFTTERKYAQEYADRAAEMRDAPPRVIRAFIKAERPLVVRFDGGPAIVDGQEMEWTSNKEALEYAKRKGYDAVWWPDGSFTDYPSITVFKSSQIKAVENAGTFDPESPNILQQRADGKDARGFITFPETRSFFKVTLTGSANLSTFAHESGHAFLEVLRGYADVNEQLAGDLEVIQGWLGVPITGEWTEAQLERFARGFEAYLREGRAPSAELAGVFQTFKSWLTWIYRTLRGLDVELTDEVRGVMDRMLATEAEIAAAQEDAALLPIESAELAGMTGAQYAAYRERFEKGAAAARDDVERRALAALERTMGEERARARADVEDLARHHPVFNAREFLRTGQRLDGQTVPPEFAGAKLDRASLEGLTDERGLRRLQFYAVAEGGIDPDDLAPLFGFKDGAELVQALATTPRREAWVRAEVAARMADRYPDSTIAALTKQAVQAVHDQEPFVKALRDELDAVGRRVGAGPARSAVEVIRRAAKERVAGMTDLEIRPDKYRRGEAAAGKEFLEALAAKDFQRAHDAKRRQLWNHFMMREASKARDEIQKRVDHLRTFDDVGTRRRIGKAGGGHLDAIDTILDGLQLRRESARAVRKRISLAAWIAEREAEGDVVAPQLKEMSELRSYRTMTLDELRAVDAAVSNIEAMARLKGKLILSKQKRDMERTAVELSEHIRSNLGTLAAPTPGDLSALEKAKEWLRSADADMKKVEFLARAMDGGKTAGLAHQLVFQPLRDAQNDRYLMQEQVHGALVKPFQELSLERRHRYAQKVGFLNSPKAGKMVRLSRRNVLAVLLNLGNDGNRKRLLEGYGWSEAEVLARLDQLLDDQDLALVEHIWKTVDSLWPAMKELSERHVGTAPERVEATPVQFPGGRRVSGGYYPIVKSRRMSYLGQQIAEREAALWEANFFAPVVEHGFTKSRGKDMSPLDLTLDVVPTHLDKVIHYLTHYEAIRGVDRLLQRGEVKAAITEGLGGEYYNTLRPWLENIAADGNLTEPLVWYERAFRHLRFGSSVVLLFGKIPTGLKQALGLITSRKELKRRHLNAGIRKFLRQGWAEVRAESPEFRFMDKQMDRDVRELFTALEGHFSELGKARGKVVEFAAMPIMLVQKFVNAVTWYAAKEQAMEEGHANPVAYADSIVSMTQTGGGAKDLAAVQRGGELRKMFTVMFSYRSVLYNQLTERGSAKSITQKAAHFWWLILLPVVVEQLLMNGVGDDEDAEDVAKRLATEFALLPTSTVPFVGDIPRAAIERRVPRFAPWVDISYRVAVAAGKAAQGDASKSDARAVADFVGMATQLPTSALWNYGSYLDQLLAGELEEPVQDLLFRNPSKWE